MNSTIDEKIKQYEKTAVEVANDMHNPNVRAENSKEVLENFPNVRLASENKSISKGGRKGFLSHFFIPTILALGIAGSIAGYTIGRNQNEAKKELDKIKQSYQKTINQILDGRNDSVKGFMRLLDKDVFAEYYGKQIFGEVDKYQKEFIKKRIEQELKEVKKWKKL